MIKLKTLLTEERLHQYDWRKLPIMEHIFNMIDKMAKEQGIDLDNLPKGEERAVVENGIRIIYQYTTLKFNSYDEYLKLVRRIADEWFIRKYVRSKTNITENVNPKTWFEIKNEQDPDGKHHDLRLTCIKCGNSQTCKCSKPKRKFEGLCYDCAGIDYAGDKLTEETGFNEKYFFVGDCRTILDQRTLFNDATEMAQAIENSKPLTKLEFIDKILENSIPKRYKLFRVMLSRNPDDFEFGEGNGFVFAYDYVSYIHYFFTL